MSGDIGPHVMRTFVLLSEAILAHDVHVYLKRPSGARPSEVCEVEGVVTQRAMEGPSAHLQPLFCYLI